MSDTFVIKVLLQLYRSRHHVAQLSGAGNLVYISLFTALYVSRYDSSLWFEIIFDIPFKILEKKITIKISCCCTLNGTKKFVELFFHYKSELINNYYTDNNRFEVTESRFKFRYSKYTDIIVI